MEKKILLLTPAFTTQGGIVNYFKVLKGKFNLPVEYFTRGARNWPHREGRIKELLRAWRDLVNLNRLLKTGNYGLVQSSTSLGSFSVIRDALFLFIAKRQGVKTVAFFRGWDEQYEKSLIGWRFGLFKWFYFSSDAMIVLSEKFKIKLVNWGYCGDVYVETTIVDQELIEPFNKALFDQKISSQKAKCKLLFLARTEKAKGLYEAIDAFEILQKHSGNKYVLTIAGDGFELENAKKRVAALNLSSCVFFTGYIAGEEKQQVFRDADIYLFPSYSEGMPNSVLEAMAFGLPVITTPVGGLTDFFQEGKHGFFIEENSGVKIAELVLRLVENDQLYNSVALCNFNYSRNHFVTPVVVERLENIYKSIIEKE